MMEEVRDLGILEITETKKGANGGDDVLVLEIHRKYSKDSSLS